MKLAFAALLLCCLAQSYPWQKLPRSYSLMPEKIRELQLSKPKKSWALSYTGSFALTIKRKFLVLLFSLWTTTNLISHLGAVKEGFKNFPKWFPRMLDAPCILDNAFHLRSGFYHVQFWVWKAGCHNLTEVTQNFVVHCKLRSSSQRANRILLWKNNKERKF